MQSLILGTAQWGKDYGVTNALGRMGDRDLAEVMQIAAIAGIRDFDTAPAYGDAEHRLRPWAQDLRVCTKVKAAGPTSIQEQVTKSLAMLGTQRLHGCLVHDWSAANSSQQQVASEALEHLREQGVITLVGVSAYEEADLRAAAGTFERLDVVQVPCNALDRRLDASPIIEDLVDRHVLIQARSVFLQGLLAAPSATPLSAHADVQAYFTACQKANLKPLSAALHAVRQRSWISAVLVGAASPHELREILAVWNQQPVDLPELPASEDLSLIDPRNWG